MTTDQESEELISRFSEVISLLEKNMKYIQSLGLDSRSLQDYRRVVSFLKGRPVKEVEIIIGRQSLKKKPKDTEPHISDEALAAMTEEQIKAQLLAPDLSRAFLERLASLRFGVTKGALATLRSREALVDKLIRLLEHEGTHAAISRAVFSGYDKKD